MLFFTEEWRGDAGVKAAGGEPQQGDGDEDDSQGVLHSVLYFTRGFPAGKRLV